MAARPLAWTLVCAFPIVLAACGSDSTAPAPVNSVEVSPGTPSIPLGQTVQLNATLRDAGNAMLTGRTIVWTTENGAVASVSASGLVTGLADGTVTISATSEGRVGTARVTIMPPPVASVEVSPATATIAAGQTAQLSATLKNASNGVLTGRTISWSSSNAAAATVSGTGLVTGVAPGNATITATSEGRSGTAQVIVSVGSSPVMLASVSPDPLVQGQSATLSGSGFSTVPASNIVTVDGVMATVTSATATSLQFTVPTGSCQPARGVDIRVTVGGQSSGPLRHPLRPASYVDLAAGQQMVIQNPRDFCLQFAQSSTSEAYLIGVQSISETVSSLTPVTVRSVGTGAAAAALPADASASAALAGMRGERTPVRSSPRAARWARHRAAEAALRAQERTHVAPRMREARETLRASLAASNSVAVAQANVGDTVRLRVPDLGRNVCDNFTAVTSVVRAMGTRGIWLEDVANPAGGFTAADFQSLSQQFDQQIYTTDTEYFGAPTDLDGNGRILVVTTREINKFNARGTGAVLGFVTSADLAGRSQCASSDNGEIYYGIAPDPQNTLGWQTYSLADARLDAPILIAHEFAHIIQFGRRLANPAATTFQSAWEMEGQATLAEEVVGYAMTGRMPGRDYGYDVAFNDPETSPISWHENAFVDLALYFGFQSRDAKAAGAPEQCSWLGGEDDGNDGPCLAGREIYGVPWSLLRWVSDHFGATYPGGEKGLHRALIANNVTLSGYANLAAVTGVPAETLLAQWAAALYVDGRIPNASPRLTFPSWNLFDIYENGRLFATTRLQPRDRTFSSFTDPITVRAGSTGYFRVSGASRAATAIAVRGAGDSPLPNTMRVWIVRLQ